MKSECKYSFQEAQLRLESFCAYQERCTREIETKLFQWNFPKKESDQLIEYLKSSGFLDDERFAFSFVSGKTRFKKWGRIKIRFHLSQKGIDKELAANALKEIDLDEYWNNLLHLTKRKFGDTKDTDQWQKKSKMTRFLASKGYESDLIHDAIEDVFKENA
jgi:regulatory protein